MKPVTSIQDFKDIKKKAKEKGFTLSNCFFLLKSIQEKIEKKLLFGEYINNGILLIENKNIFYRCYYFLSPDTIPSHVEFEKETVIELPFQENLTYSQKQQIEQIISMGFNLGRSSGMMGLSSDEVRFICSDYPFDNISFAEKKDCDEVMRLLTSCFNPLYAFLPDEEELLNNIAEQRVWILKEKGVIAAVLNSRYEKNTAAISHVGVDSKYRGKGYGKKLVETYHRFYRDRVRIFQHWVDLENSYAINMYKKFGYQFSLRKANEYLYLP